MLFTITSIYLPWIHFAIVFEENQYFGFTSVDQCILLQPCTATKEILEVAHRSASDSIEDELKSYMLNWRVNDVMQWWSDHEANFLHIALLAPLKY